MQASPPKHNIYYGYFVVVAALFIMIAIMGVRYSFGVFIKPMLGDFGWTRAMISAAFSISWIVESAATIFLGGLNDRIGPRIVMSICGFISGASYLLMSHINDITHLYIIYGVLLGAGNGVFTPLVSTTARWFASRRTAMTGMVTTGIGIGSLMWPPIIERLIAISDWRITSSIIGAVVLIIAITAAQFLKSDPSQISKETLTDKQSNNGKPKPAEESFSLKQSLCTSQFWTVFIIFFCYGASFLTVQVHAVPYVTDLGISATTAASILTTVGGASIIGRIVLGGIGDRIGNRQTMHISFILMLLMMIWLTFTREVWGFYLFAVVFGIGYGGFAAQQSPLVARLFGLTSLGLIFGVVITGFTLGAAIGPLISGYIFDVSGNYQTAFLICIALLVIGIFLNVILKPTRISSIGKL